MTSLLPNRRTGVAALLIAANCGLIEFANGRPPICPCSTVKLW